MNNIGNYLAGLLVIVAVACFWLMSGCAAGNLLVDNLIGNNPDPEDLYVTEEDVATMLGELSTKTPTDPDAVLYNETKNVFEMKPEAYKKAVTSGVMYELQKKKIAEFLKHYKQRTFWGELKKDIGDGIIITIIGIAAFLSL